MNLAHVVLGRKAFARNYLVLTFLVLTTVVALVACKKKEATSSAPSTGVATIQADAPLSSDDVSILFPAPKSAADFANLIAVRDITTPNPQDTSKRDPVWSDSAFQQFMTIVNGPAAAVGTSAQIN